MAKKTVEQILLERSLISREQMEKVREESRKKGIPVSRLLVQSGAVSEEIYAQTLAEILDIVYMDLTNYLVDPEAVKLVPENIARKNKVIPLFKIGNTLTVAMADPRDILAIDELTRLSRCEIEPVISGENGILNAIDRYYGTGSSINEVIKDISKDKAKGKVGAPDVKNIAEIIEQPPIIKLVNLIISQAVRDRASDIHIEPEEETVKVRFRIDGVLHEMFSPPKHLEPALISRIKVLAGLDIAERRRPQDGRFNIRMENRDIDFRVATFPTVYGENIVIRILDRAALLLGLDKIGFSSDVQKEFEKLIKKTHGIILVTGPTGSGKTTTLYSALSAIDSEERNIITIEDPVEYRLGRIRQSQINPRAGLTFATGLRSILRQDPDVIMVGEIRDRETADISVQAALTGHLVFSTLHTNDASSTVARLLDMGIEPFLVSSSLIGILAQRLVRRICDRCKEVYKPSEDIVAGLGVRHAELFRGKGCKACKHTGYKGRIGIFELLVVSEDIRKLIVERTPSDIIKDKAISLGMKTLKEDGIDKVLKGITTVDELIKATQEG